MIFGEDVLLLSACVCVLAQMCSRVSGERMRLDTSLREAQAGGGSVGLCVTSRCVLVRVHAALCSVEQKSHSDTDN